MADALIQRDLHKWFHTSKRNHSIVELDFKIYNTLYKSFLKKL